MSDNHQYYLAVIGGLLSRTANLSIGWNPARRPHTRDAHNDRTYTVPLVADERRAGRPHEPAGTTTGYRR